MGGFLIPAFGGGDSNTGVGDDGGGDGDVPGKRGNRNRRT